MRFCVNCGAKSTDGGERFCERCGTALPDAVGATAPPPPPPPGPPPVPAADPDRRRGLPLPVTVGVVLVGIAAVAFLAVAFLGGSSGGGGAGSPEEAVQDLVAAIDAEDPLSALSTLSPREVQSFSDVYEALEGRIADAGLGGSSSSSILDGIEVSVTDLELRTRQINDDVARVEITDAVVTFALDTEAASPLLTGADVEGGEARLSDLLDEARENGSPVDELALIVIDDGGWYVSPLYTLAELGTELADLPGGDFRSLEQRDREDPPEDVEALFDDLAVAIEDLDVEGALELMSLDAFGIERVYEDAIAELITMAEEELGGSLDDVLDIRVDAPEVSAEERGDVVIATIEELGGQGTARDAYDGTTASGTVSFDGECLDGRDDQGGRGRQCIPDRFFELSGLPRPFLVAVEEDGGVRLSPMATLMEYGRILAENVQTETALRALDLVQHQAPSDELVVGQEATITLSEAGTWVGAFEGSEGEVVSFGSEGFDADIRLFGPDGDEVQWCSGSSDGERACVATLDTTGAHRLAVVADEWSPEEGTIGLHVPQVTDGTFPGTLEGSNEQLGSASIFRIAPDGRIELSSDESFDVFDEDMAWVSVEDVGAGDVVLVVVRTRGAFAVEASEPPPLGFVEAGGSTSLSGSIGSGQRRTHALTVPEESFVTVEVVPDSDFDVRIEVRDPFGELIGSADRGFSGDRESISFEAFEQGTYELTVSGYLGDFGSYQATVYDG